MKALGTILLGSLGMVLGGCSCGNSDFDFPDEKQVQYAPEPDAIGSWLSMDASPEGERLTLAYYLADRGALGYAVGTIQPDDSIFWQHERVDAFPESNGLNLNDRGRYASQKTAPDGTVWVAYYDINAGDLYAAQRLGPANWSEPMLVDAGTTDAGKWASLTYDGNGAPMVAYTDGAAVKVARFTDDTWLVNTLYQSTPFGDREAGVAYTTAFSDGASDYVAFQDLARGDLHLLSGNTGAVLTDSIIDEDGNVGAWPSIYADAQNVWVAYQDVEQQTLKFATSVNGQPFSTTVLDDGPLRGADTLIYIENDLPRVLYANGYDNDVMLAEAGNDWVTGPVLQDGALGFHNEHAFVGGRNWIASYDQGSKQPVFLPLQ